MKCPKLAESHHLQHGYKRSSSTLQAEFLIRETLQYYNSNNSPVYVCGLDAEKAFDSCNWDILFEKLYYEKQVPLSIVNVIKSLYVQSTAQVKYCNTYSEHFSLSQGVRQGSVLSPHLYNIYTEELLSEIEKNLDNVGTSLSNQFTGILMYADDIILMSTTLEGLRNLIDTCLSISKKNCINFNSDKTEFCISYNKDFSNNCFMMNGYKITPSSSLKHLGVLWNVRRNILTMEDENIDHRVSKFWAVIKSLIKDGIRFCQPQTIKQLYLSLAVPTLTYGIELCNLTDNLLTKLDTECRKGLKVLFNVSMYSKNYLNTILNIENVSTIIIRNKYRLLIRLLHNKKIASLLVDAMQSQGTNHLINDLRAVSQKLNINFMDVIVSRQTPLIVNMYKQIEEQKVILLLQCINNWKNLHARKRFVDIMEERVVR